LNQRLWNKNFILLAIGNLFMAMGFYFLIPTLPIYVVDVLKVEPHQVGYILAAYTVSAMIIRPFTGIAVDRYGRKWIFLISFFIFILMIAAYSLMTTFLALLLLRFLHGFAWGVNTTSGATAVVDIIPPNKRGRGLGYFGISFTISMALGPLFALLILHHYGFNGMFLAAALVAFTGFLLVLPVSYVKTPRNHEKFRFTFDRFFESGSLPIAVTYMFFGLTYGGIVSYITLYDQELGLNMTGPFFILLAAGIFASRILAGRIFDMQGPYWLIVTGMFTTIAGFIVLAFASHPYGFLLAAFLTGLGSGILMPTLQAMVNNIVSIERRGIANATLITAFDLGIGAGSLILGFIADWTGLAGMFLICAGIMLLALVFYKLFVHRFYQEHRARFLEF